MEAQGNTESWSLENTPTWAVATVCTVFVTISLLVVTAIKKIENHLKHNHRKPLVHALHRMKEELMLMGFISLLLTVFQNYVSSLCVKTSLLKDWTPCPIENKETLQGATDLTKGRRRLLTIEDSWPKIDTGDESLFQGRILSQSAARACKAGHSPLVSNETLHQLHTLIFVLAVVHIIYSLFAMLLASTKVNGWKVWEEEAHQYTEENLREVVRSLSLHRQTTFIKHHTSKPWSRNRFFGWTICFFRQFGKSVVRSDYLAIRQGFITNHNTGRSFDFRSYIIRSLEDEYQKVVGISASLWFFAILYMLFNVVGTNLFFWLSTVPAVLLLLVGAKLQRVIATLALESAGFTRNGLYAGTALKPRDELFWFKRPQLILKFVHFILFQNAFEMATFLSFSWQFGLRSCLLRNKAYVYTRIAIGVIVQITCSYSTLPLYALVTQMGSDYKQAIFQDHVREKIHHWRLGAKRKLRNGTSAADHDGGSTVGHQRRMSTDSNSPDEVGPKTVHDSKNDTRLEFTLLEEPIEEAHSQSAPQDLHFLTLEISRGNENDCQPILIPGSPSPPQMPFYTGAKSEIKAPTQAVSKKFCKQLSSDPRAARSES
ncbi:unnamed protein product [Calypogeia fissa]